MFTLDKNMWLVKVSQNDGISTFHFKVHHVFASCISLASCSHEAISEEISKWEFLVFGADSILLESELEVKLMQTITTTTTKRKELKKAQKFYY